jgi:transcriptional regulator with XRE-family HTH domain
MTTAAALENFDPTRWASIRVAAGISQAELARRMKVDPANLCKWESGKHTPFSWNLSRWRKELQRAVRLAGQREVRRRYVPA